ncbi:MAG TPA: hypothetical protein DHW71_05255 [Gammaproteobacteria bacterium]|nr:hypothetical protein [Gammaproteobacteria bacterium]MEC8011590.1 hypothetical protein [Pseudomonadota bacterium]HBF09536.1 hypothetical protein [Gammaproteobacteria bacterium]HCK92370.1 hypothetical protein [Gammaproteobacteria bacterium]|tara:strand:+ start:274 stop:1425 length:1152 start_codon:yes stop_codon:yes gene_type:complete
MKHVVPLFAENESAIDEFIDDACHNLEYEFFESSGFKENLKEVSAKEGVALFVPTEAQDFLEMIHSLHNKMKKNKVVVAVCLEGVDSNDAEQLVQELESYELVFCIKSMQNMSQEVSDLIQFRKFLMSIQEKSDDFKIMAYQAMETAAEIGLITLLLEKSINIDALDDMTNALFDTMKSLNASGSILYTSLVTMDEYYFSDDQEYKEKEKKLMGAYRDHLHENSTIGRFKTFSGRLLVAGKYVTVLIRNLPDDEEEQGRIRDTFGAFINAADFIASNIESRIAKEKRQKVINDTIDAVGETVEIVQGMFKSHEKKTMQTMDELICNTEEGLAILGLTEEQENYFINHLEIAMANLVAMYSSGIAIENQFDTIVSNINNIRHLS